jgi:glutaredoxin
MKTSTAFVLIAVVGGVIQNRDKITRWFHPAPAISQRLEKNEVILYSTTWCGYCAKTREYFAENNIDYIDLDVEHSEEGRQGYESLGGNGVPIVVINTETVIHGYNPEGISAALNNTAPE